MAYIKTRICVFLLAMGSGSGSSRRSVIRPLSPRWCRRCHRKAKSRASRLNPPSAIVAMACLVLFFVAVILHTHVRIMRIVVLPPAPTTNQPSQLPNAPHGIAVICCLPVASSSDAVVVARRSCTCHRVELHADISVLLSMVVAQNNKRRELRAKHRVGASGVGRPQPSHVSSCPPIAHRKKNGRAYRCRRFQHDARIAHLAVASFPLKGRHLS